MNEREIFAATMEKTSEAERAAFLDRACGGDAALRGRIEALLREQGELGSFLELPPTAVSEAVGDLTTDAPHERPGTVVGAYTLLEPIGEGGMGTVYMAAQTAPVRRMVALKVIKPGMDSRQVLARFHAERQALALMDHPNIARVLDAGTTEQGRPYFVMELVKGVPITRFCDQRRLTPRERLELFLPVCQAVQHAHQKGVIHRDIKPSNVMVALYDGRPVPKVIDFGVAKAVGQKLIEATLLTGFGTLVGTPEYMSPEQAELNQLDIDTRSDIYSLGVLLYELLTGSTPIDRRRFREAALLEVLRVIREEDPQRPSTRLSTTEELPSIATCRNVEPRRLAGLVRGELDWIVMKALEKDRDRRYATAIGLAADVERHLRDEPVEAGPPSAFYRLAKFARRHRSPVLAGSMIAALLIAGVAGTGWGLWRSAVEGRAKAEALRDAEAHFARSREIVDRMLTRVAEDLLPDVPRMEAVRRAILEDALAYYREFLRARSADAALNLETSRLHQRYGNLCLELGRHHEAEAALAESLAILDRLAGEGDDTEGVLLVRSQSLAALGVVYSFLWKDSKARKAQEQSLDCAERLAAASPGSEEYRLRLLQARVSYAQALAVDDPERALAMAGRVLTDVAETDMDRRLRVSALALSGDVLPRLDRPGEAAVALDKAVSIAEELVVNVGEPAPARERSRLGGVLLARARCALARSEAEAADRDARRAVSIYERLTDDFPGVVNYRVHLVQASVTLARAGLDKQQDEQANAAAERAKHDLLPLLADEAAVGGRDGSPMRVIVGGGDWGDGPALPGVVEEWGPCEAGRLNRMTLSALLDLVHLLTKLDARPSRRGRAVEADVLFERAVPLLLDAADPPAGGDPRPAAASGLATALALASVAGDLERQSRARDAEVYTRWAIAFFEKSRARVPLAEVPLERLAGEYFRRGRLLVALGRGREAVNSYRTAADLYGELIDAGTDRREAFRFARASSLNNVAWTLAKAADATEADAREAVRLGRLAVELAPKTGDFRNTLGIALYRAGDLAGAIETLTISMAMRNGGDAADWFPLAIARRRLGDEAEARRLLGLAVEWMEKHAPNDPDLLGLREAAEAALSDPPPAAERARGPD